MPTDIDVNRVTEEKFVFMQARIDYKGKEQFTKFEKFTAPKKAWTDDLQPGKKCKVTAVKDGSDKLKVTITGTHKDGKTEVKSVAGFIKFV